MATTKNAAQAKASEQEQPTMAQLMALIKGLSGQIDELKAENDALKNAPKTAGVKRERDAERAKEAKWNGVCVHCKTAFVADTGFMVVVRTGYKTMCKACHDAGKGWIEKAAKIVPIKKSGVHCATCNRVIQLWENATYTPVDNTYTCLDCKKPEIKKPATKTPKEQEIYPSADGKRFYRFVDGHMVDVTDAGKAF